MAAAYPTTAEAEAYVSSLNLGLTAAQITALLMATKIDAAIDAFESLVGWSPFLAAGADSSRRYDPPGPQASRAPWALYRGGGKRLDLDGGLTAAPTALVTGYSATEPGTTLTLETDYFLWPANAAAKGQPYTAIEFNASQSGMPQSIRITGRFGYSQTVPDDVFQAILQYAASLAAAQMGAIISGGVVEWREKDITEKYGDQALSGLLAQWRAAWETAIARYRRIVF